jgi:hypothetical protein
MIKITVEIVPFGNTNLTRRLWEIEVSNIKINANNVADYMCYCKNITENTKGHFKVTKHKRDVGLARLLAKVFKKMDEEL